MAKIAPLCSSSKGNSVFVGNDSQGILIDCGCSFKALKGYLATCGIPFDAIKAVVITHEHIDHVKGLLQLMKHTSLPVFASDGTKKKISELNLCDNPEVIKPLSELKSIECDCHLEYFRTPHDSSESVGYVVELYGHKIACCTDLGYVTDEVRRNVLGCECVYLEANYDPDMLRMNFRYPPALKRRISGNFGHLSNNDSADFCCELVKNGTTRLILGHLSQENNTPNIAFQTVNKKLSSDNAMIGRDYTLDVARVVTEGNYIAI